MSPINFEAIERLKVTAMRRCEERIKNAAERTVREGVRNEPTIPRSGVTCALKRKYGL